MPFDQQENFVQLASYLNYTNFDLSKDFNLTERLEGQDLLSQTLIPILYRCDR